MSEDDSFLEAHLARPAALPLDEAEVQLLDALRRTPLPPRDEDVHITMPDAGVLDLRGAPGRQDDPLTPVFTEP